MPLPSDKLVTYKARQTPSDPNSNVLMEHELHISAKSQNGDEITWGINKLKFSQPGGRTWTVSSPGLGNWVVTHADPENPVASEFSAPPTMSGAAAPDSGSGDDLDYSLAAGSCTTPELQMYGGAVACSAYSYVAGSTTIAEEDDDEPEEIDSVNDPD